MKKKKTIWDVEYYDKDEDEEYAKEEGIEDEEEEHTGTHEDAKLDIATGKEEENIYSEEGRDLEVEEDEIEPWEEGYAEGAESKSGLRKEKRKGR